MKHFNQLAAFRRRGRPRSHGSQRRQKEIVKYFYDSRNINIYEIQIGNPAGIA